MRKKIFKILILFIALALMVAPVNASPRGDDPAAAPKEAMSTPLTSDGAILTESDGEEGSALKTSHRLIVELASPALAVWARSTGAALLSSGKLDVNAPDAQAYVAQLKTEQDAFVSSMKNELPGAAVGQYINEAGARVDLTYQVTFNGMAIDAGTTDQEAARKTLARLPGVKAVYFDYAHQPDLYASLPLINAEAAWNHASIGGMENAGEGIKVASMDGGVHHDAPMFDGTGYSYPPGYPPNGLGNTENNNGKIIASRVYFRTWDPPSAGDENPWPGTQGTPHGNHTASIAAGDEVVADFLGVTETISGVAPKAWVMSYRVFYNSITNDGSFYTAEGIAALEDIMMDGADVLNNSWGGGPGSTGGAFDPLDTALINVANAGTFVSMSAGNAGPGNGTTDHPSDEYISVAASTTEGTLAAGRLNVTAPPPVPDTLTDMSFGVALFGDPLPVGTTISYTFMTAASVDLANVEGCNAWAGTPFTGNAVLVQRGTCEFSQKVYYAQQGGAEFVVVYNNAAGGDSILNMSPGAFADLVTISSIFVGQTNGEDMVDWYDTNGAASELELNTLAFQAGNDPDILASFSSRGPGVGNLLRPDITAPGVNILAQGFAPGVTGEDRHLGFGQVSGTSMAAPHVAGAAALLRQIYPTWSNAQIKSALMSTSKYIGIWNGDGTHAQPLDMGAGRLDLTNAANPGVILDPPSLSYGVVLTGTVETMDVMVTSVASAAETYSLTAQLIQGSGFVTPTVSAHPSFSVSPANLTLDPGETVTVTVTFDSTDGEIGDNQGHILLDGASHDAHFPAWARVTPPAAADVLIIDNDLGPLVGLPDYVGYYTDTLDNLGVSYDVWDADLNFGNPTTIPEAAVLMAYDVVIYFTGDNFFPDGTFTVATPLTELDQNRVTEFANSGGIIIAMGQDLSSVNLTDSFFYNFVLGGGYLQDSVTAAALPSLPVVPLAGAPEAFDGVSLDLSGAGDGAANQAFIDEIETTPSVEPDSPDYLYPYAALLRYPGPNNVEDGTVAMAHRDQPSLERPGISYLGRSVYTSFGLEGVNNDTGMTTREELVQAFLNWAMDEPTVVISDVTTANASDLTMFEATLDSNIAGTAGVSYRWDFGDGSAYTAAYESNQVSHTYEVCGTYTVRVEATDSWGNKTIGTLQVPVSQCEAHVRYLPVVAKSP